MPSIVFVNRFVFYAFIYRRLIYASRNVMLYACYETGINVNKAKAVFYVCYNYALGKTTQLIGTRYFNKTTRFLGRVYFNTLKIKPINVKGFNYIIHI